MSRKTRCSQKCSQQDAHCGNRESISPSHTFSVRLRPNRSRWVLRDHFQVSLIFICIDRNGKVNDTILPVNSRFLCNKIESTSYPIRGIRNDLWRNKIISFFYVVTALVRINTQMRFAIAHEKNHRSGKDDISTISIVNRGNETALPHG